MTSSSPPPPSGDVLITDIDFDGDGPRVTVTFSDDVDGATMPLGFIKDTTANDSTGAFEDQPTSNSARYTVAETWNSGDDWNLEIPQLPLTFPQSGTVT